MRISKICLKVGRGLQEPRGLKFLTTESIVFMKGRGLQEPRGLKSLQVINNFKNSMSRFVRASWIEIYTTT